MDQSLNSGYWDPLNLGGNNALWARLVRKPDDYTSGVVDGSAADMLQEILLQCSVGSLKYGVVTTQWYGMEV